MALSEDMKRLARDVFNDVSSTYQAVLTQNTGWTNTSLFYGGLEQEISADATRKHMVEPLQPAQDAPELTIGGD